MQEHYFGKARKDIAPLTPGGPVLDQMMFGNLMGCGISIALCLANYKDTMKSLDLAFEISALRIDSKYSIKGLVGFEPNRLVP